MFGEFLVEKFEEDYRQRGENMLDFIMGHWSSCMVKELEEMALQDHEVYSKGRIELGVLGMTCDDLLFNVQATGLVGEVDADHVVGHDWFGKEIPLSWYLPRAT